MLVFLCRDGNKHWRINSVGWVARGGQGTWKLTEIGQPFFGVRQPRLISTHLKTHWLRLSLD